MSAPGTPKASEAAIAAVQNALGCEVETSRDHATGEYDAHCATCGSSWTERGCRDAVAAADAAIAADSEALWEEAMLDAAKVMANYLREFADGMDKGIAEAEAGQ